MPMWIRLLQDKKVTDIHTGSVKQFKRFDWLEVGKQTALLWIAQGIADKPGFNVADEYIDSTSGIVVIGSTESQVFVNIAKELKDVPMLTTEKHQMCFSENMIVKDQARVRPELIPIGFKLLENFQIAMPLWSYDELAIHLAKPDQIEELEAILHDLRVPVFNTKLMFIRRCEDTENLLNLFEQYKEKGLDDRLAFQVAFYLSKPVMCALPVSWC